MGFLGLGFQPKWGVADTPVMPKGRYEIMRNYMPTVGSMGLDMMFRTTTIQVRTSGVNLLVTPYVRFLYWSDAEREERVCARICDEHTPDGAVVVISPQPSLHHSLFTTASLPSLCCRLVEPITRHGATRFASLGAKSIHHGNSTS